MINDETQKHLIIFKTVDYLQYLETMAVLIKKMIRFFSNKTDAYSLSAQIILGYYFSSLVATNPKIIKNPFGFSTRTKPIQEVFDEQRDDLNDLLFLNRVFTHRNNAYVCRFKFSNEIIGNFVRVTKLTNFYLPEKRGSSNTEQIYQQLEKILPKNIQKISEKRPNSVETAFMESLCESSNLASTQLYGEKFLNLLDSHGIDSNTLVHSFVILLYEEYYKAIAQGKSESIFFDKHKTANIQFLAYNDPLPLATERELNKFKLPIKLNYQGTKTVTMNKKYERMIPLLPKPTTNLKKNKEIVKNHHKKAWQQLGVRSAYLQLFLNTNIEYHKLEIFHRKTLCLLYVYTKMVPTNNADRLYRMENGLQYSAIRATEEKQGTFRDIVITEEMLEDENILKNNFNYNVNHPRK